METESPSLELATDIEIFDELKRRNLAFVFVYLKDTDDLDDDCDDILLCYHGGIPLAIGLLALAKPKLISLATSEDV